MKSWHATAISVALLVGVWAYLRVGMPNLHLNPWLGFVAGAAFFAAAGGGPRIAKAGGAGLTGMIPTIITLVAVQFAGGGVSALVVSVTLLALVLVMMADAPTFAFTPRAFDGTACFFGSSNKLDFSLLLSPRHELPESHSAMLPNILAKP